MKLVQIKEIKGTIEILSGLHIGSGDMEMRIGGTDNPVIKHPHTGEPFIPGSSLKGKVRSLLELASGAMAATKGSPLSLRHLPGLHHTVDSARCENIIKLFGTSGSDSDLMEERELGPTRVSFADCPLEKEWKKGVDDKALPYVEVKSENSINRITGTAQNPRFTERVPAGARFSFSVNLKVFENEPELCELLLNGLGLLELDSLGGSGSRGYGRLRIQFADPEVRAKVDAFKKTLTEVAA